MTVETNSSARSVRRSRVRRPLAVVAAVALGMLALVPAAPAAAIDPAQISGTVTSVDSGLPIQNVRVQVLNAGFSTSVYTDVAGNYSVTGIPDGSYRIRFNVGDFTTGSFVSEYWDDEVLYSQAPLVSLAAGDSPTFSASLATGGKVTGTVTGIDGPGIFAVYAYLQDSAHPTVFDQLTGTIAAADGTYTLRGLAPGNYQVTFGDNYQGSGGTKYYLEAWDNHYYGSGDLVTVSGTGTTANISGQLTVPGPVPVTRLAGADRFATSAAVWSDPTKYPDGMGGTIYIASGRSFPDALGAGPAAAQQDSVLMLVEPNSVPTVIREQIQRIAPDDIIMVGGPGALSETVKNQLQALVSNEVQRISGTDRYDTSRKIIRSAFNFSQRAKVLVIATGANFPDALSAGPAAANRFNSPVLLVPGNGTLSAADFTLIADLDPEQIVIVGGTGAVSSGIESQLVGTGHPVTRVAGADRYATSIAVNAFFFTPTSASYLAVGTGFADALSGAARAAAEGSRLFVTPATCVPMDELLALKVFTPTTIYLLGGTGALSARVEAFHRC